MTADLQVTDIGFDWESYQVFNFDAFVLQTYPYGDEDVLSPSPPFTTDYDVTYNSNIWSSGSSELWDFGAHALTPGDYSTTVWLVRFQNSIREYPYHLAGFQVVGNTLQPIPEPSTWTLFGIGLAGLAGAEVRRRRKKKEVGKGEVRKNHT